MVTVRNVKWITTDILLQWPTCSLVGGECRAHLSSMQSGRASNLLRLSGSAYAVDQQFKEEVKPTN